ncbi:ABC transporter permease [Paenibacillus sp. GSMTC-2017]|uniref:ABC transporter permease n=1 Tax=Paenibacillus sp. GSMTC-2017 TaxID=2794350 RepID=UPI0018D7615E|nr:ABC transporter permease [Paenibacillus sp. GSMTC-2017]MBH5317263.1 ABC transporter permease [Paenibacillus sp. GSMTC-2017]
MNAKIRPEQIWQERARAFRVETMPYFRYMAQSGFPSFLSLILIASTISYITLIKNFPSDFPVTWVGIIALTPVICWSPLRTFFAHADIVYLMPREHEIGSYIGKSYRHSIRISVLIATAVFLLYLPIYLNGEATSGPWILALALVLLKAANAVGGWQERKMSWTSIRNGFRLLRWILTALTIAVWLIADPWKSAGFTILCILLVGLSYRIPLSQRIPWERLIAEEITTHRRFYVFFGMFIDVPTMSSTISRRPYLAWMLPRISFSQKNTFVYLYGASLFRTEIGGILTRILLLGLLVIYWSADAASLEGWGAVFVYAIFAVVFCLQAGGLRVVHQYSVWKNIYPLPTSQRVEQLLRIDRATLITGLLLLWIPMAIPLLWKGIVVPPITALVVMMIYIGIRPTRYRKKLQTEAEEE